MDRVLAFYRNWSRFIRAKYCFHPGIQACLASVDGRIENNPDLAVERTSDRV